jgi:hypothetical protein
MLRSPQLNLHCSVPAQESKGTCTRDEVDQEPPLRGPAAPADSNQVRRVLRLYDDHEIKIVFDSFKTVSSDNVGSISTENLMKALAELGVTLESDEKITGVTDSEAFMRIVRSPREAEQFFQMMPLAGLLARSLGKTDLDGLGSLGKDDVSAGLQVFSQSVASMVRERLRKLKDQLEKLRAVDQASGNSKFGGQLEGGTVNDFHDGLADRLGELFLFRHSLDSIIQRVFVIFASPSRFRISSSANRKRRA